MRCCRSNRTCRGYEGDITFKQYSTHESTQTAAFTSAARKCSLPVRQPLPGTDMLPVDLPPIETPETDSQQYALRAFFYNYCTVSDNAHLSRGYLCGLEALARRLGPKSDLVNACEAVAFAAHAKPLNRPRLLDIAEAKYRDLLGSLARVIDTPDLVHPKEPKLVAMLLGLYEVLFTWSVGSWFDAEG